MNDLEIKLQNIIAQVQITSCCKEMPYRAARKIIEYLKKNYDLKPKN